jgi:hypothetical protein
MVETVVAFKFESSCFNAGREIAFRLLCKTTEKKQLPFIAHDTT